MAEIEVRTTRRDTGEVSTSKIDVYQIIEQVRSYAKKARSGGNLPFDVKVDGFSVSVGQSNKNLKVKVGVDLGVKRKQMPPK